MSSDDRDSRGESESRTSSPTDPTEKEESASSSKPRPDAGNAGSANGSHEGAEPAAEPTAAGTETAPPPAAPPVPYYDDPYEAEKAAPPKALAKAVPPPPAPPAPPSDEDESGDEEEGMARMSFLEHLEELRTRIIRALAGLVVAYAGCLVLANPLFSLIKGPFDRAVESLPPGVDAKMVQSTAMEGFQLLYLKVPLLAAVFVAAPWLMYQAWAFISPGLYRRERRWAAPFILSTAGLFILGGVFGYFVALKFALAFLVGISQDLGVSAYVTMTSYFDNFVGIMLGLGLVFQMPILIFFLTLIRVMTPRFLLNNVRYAILLIFVLAAVITPTPDVFNMLLFALPMILLFYVGIGASYVLVFRRENRKIPWMKVILAILVLAALIGGAAYFVYAQMGYDFVFHSPYLIHR